MANKYEQLTTSNDACCFAATTTHDASALRQSMGVESNGASDASAVTNAACRSTKHVAPSFEQ